MTETAKKALPKVNLDEFERRLRATGPQTQTKEDPLAELARLIGMEDNVTPLFTQADVKIKPAEARVADAAHPLELPVRDRSSAPTPAAPLAAPPAPPAPAAPPTVEHHDYQPPAARDAAPAAEMAPESYAGDDASEQFQDAPQEAPAEMEEAQPRRRRSSLIPSVLVIIGVAGLMGAWAYRGAPGLPKAPPLIMAADGPTKVQAPTPADSSAKSDNASILLKDAQTVSSPVKVVTSEEQPVDLQQQANVAPAPAPAAAAPDAPAADASAPPAPAAPAPAPIAIAPAPPPSQLFPEPKRVKTVSVRPDGTLISADTAPSTAPLPNPVKSLSRPSIDPGAPAAAVQPATPKVDLPAHAASKSTARVPIAKIDTTASPAADQAAPPPATPAGAQDKADKAAEKAQKAAEKAEKAKAAKAAKAQQAADAATAATASAAATPATAAPADAKPAKAAKTQQVADATPAAPAPAAGGGAYSVQLAAPPSEEEAQATASKLSAKYATELGGLQPTIHKAEVNGKELYRVRVGGLSREDAHALCAKLEASGGKCFVAH